jgi:hypothetical protein
MAFLGACLVLNAQTPVVNRYSDIGLGSVVPGASTGTVVLNSPSGTRTATGGTSLGPSLGTSLGSLTLTGKPGDGWAISAGSAIPFTLSGPGGATLRVTVVDFEPSATNTGTFPASGTTGFFYLGVTLAVGTTGTTPPGTYTGSFSLGVRDTTNGRNSTTTFAVRAKVDPVITLTLQQNLAFGDVYAGPSAGTVVLDPNGLRTFSGGVQLGTLSPFYAASFTVTGAPNASYAITLPGTVTLSAPGATLLLSSLVTSPALTGQFNAGGAQTLTLGGTLQVAANQLDGDYSGTFPVTVAYN